MMIRGMPVSEPGDSILMIQFEEIEGEYKVKIRAVCRKISPKECARSTEIFSVLYFSINVIIIFRILCI